MEAYIPYLFALIALNEKKLKEDNLYRMSAMAVVGASYFLLLQYILYYNQIFNPQGIMQYLPMLIAVGGVIGLCYSPWFGQTSAWKTSIFIGAMLLSFPLTRLLDIPIKHAIADASGFFQEGPLRINTADQEPLAGERFELALIAHEIIVPDGWSKGQLEADYDYIYLERNGQRLVEIRPNCLTEVKLDAPTTVENYLWSPQGDKHVHAATCTRDASAIACFVAVIYDDDASPAERWQWFTINNAKKLHTSIGAVFYSTESHLRDEAARIIGAVAPIEGGQPVICSTPSAWL